MAPKRACPSKSDGAVDLPHKCHAFSSYHGSCLPTFAAASLEQLEPGKIWWSISICSSFQEDTDVLGLTPWPKDLRNPNYNHARRRVLRPILQPPQNFGFKTKSGNLWGHLSITFFPLTKTYQKIHGLPAPAVSTPPCAVAKSVAFAAPPR